MLSSAPVPDRLGALHRLYVCLDQNTPSGSRSPGQACAGALLRHSSPAASAYTLQIVGQRGLDPTIASLAMCLESVFGALAGWALLGQKLSLVELTGCLLMFAAIVGSTLATGHGAEPAAPSRRNPPRSRILPNKNNERTPLLLAARLRPSRSGGGLLV